MNRSPRQFTRGEAGESRVLALELRVLADVGLLGLPNAGKSTFLRAVSSARPKVADYPFTTLTPNLGVVRLGDEPSPAERSAEQLLGRAFVRVCGESTLPSVSLARILVCARLPMPSASTRSASVALAAIRYFMIVPARRSDSF